MSDKRKHDPEDRSSSEWLDRIFRISGISGPIMGGKTQEQADAEQEYRTHPDAPDWVAPDEVDPDDDGNITVTILSVEGERKMPEPPRGVVIHLVNGEQRATEVVWVGTGLTGIEMWEVTARFRFDEIKNVTIEFLPAGSEVHIGGPGGPSAAS